MRRACVRRDASYDGVFFLAVKSTGVFCRPSCPARTPQPANVRYFATAEEAQQAGFRACRRCHPLATNGAPPTWVQTLLTALTDDPPRRLRDDDLRALGIDPARARRYFKRHFGMTFQAYQRDRNMGNALDDMQAGTPLHHAGLDHGYNSTSGFRDAFQRTFGQPPGRAGTQPHIVTRMLASPLGPLLVAATPAAVCLLEFVTPDTLAARRKALQQRFDCPIVPGSNVHLDRLADELAAYFAGDLRQFTVPLVYPGTPFQMQVWRGLLKIPYGQTWSYERLAEHVGRPGAQRAVGSANGRNRIAILIPCHRVVNKSGRLGGYGGGLWRKQALLDLERRV